MVEEPPPKQRRTNAGTNSKLSAIYVPSDQVIGTRKGKMTLAEGRKGKKRAFKFLAAQEKPGDRIRQFLSMSVINVRNVSPHTFHRSCSECWHRDGGRNSNA